MDFPEGCARTKELTKETHGAQKGELKLQLGKKKKCHRQSLLNRPTEGKKGGQESKRVRNRKRKKGPDKKREYVYQKKKGTTPGVLCPRINLRRSS